MFHSSGRIVPDSELNPLSSSYPLFKSDDKSIVNNKSNIHNDNRKVKTTNATAVGITRSNVGGSMRRKKRKSCEIEKDDEIDQIEVDYSEEYVPIPRKTREGMISRDEATRARKIMDKICSNHISPPFMAPVDPITLNIPDYFDIIKTPMDLGTIKRNLNGEKYSHISQWDNDVELVFDNAKKYNPITNLIHVWADTLLTEYLQLRKEVFPEYRKKRGLFKLRKSYRKKMSKSFSNDQ